MAWLKLLSLVWYGVAPICKHNIYLEGQRKLRHVTPLCVQRALTQCEGKVPAAPIKLCIWRKTNFARWLIYLNKPSAKRLCLVDVKNWMDYIYEILSLTFHKYLKHDCLSIRRHTLEIFQRHFKRLQYP